MSNRRKQSLDVSEKWALAGVIIGVLILIYQLTAQAIGFL